jgi:hypothetical protein
MAEGRMIGNAICAGISSGSGIQIKFPREIAGQSATSKKMNFSERVSSSSFGQVKDSNEYI